MIFFFKIKYHTKKKKKKDKDKSLHTPQSKNLITILNIYNSLDNIKFTNEKKMKKNLPSTWFFKNKVPYKKKKKDKSLYSPPFKY